MALDHAASLLACRALLNTLSVCTTGSTSLSATTTGYARASGSFLTDGFRVGMEVTPTSFTSTGNQVIKALTATLMTIDGTITADTASARTISVTQPEYRMYPNMDFKLTQAAGRPYTEEEWLPGVVNVQGVGPFGVVIHEPVYIVKMWGLSGKGDAAMSAYVQSIMELFAPRTTITTGGGTVLRVKERPGPFSSQLTNPPDKPGRAVVTITIPLWCQIANDI
jgi:hypothetical protein